MQRIEGQIIFAKGTKQQEAAQMARKRRMQTREERVGECGHQHDDMKGWGERN